ncbi:MAG: ATP-dependent Clp protease ATP-binding subunit [Candidatus Omnitrophica bacterium]|nr:ATP-dependent Clp protease ATP-binding subunit [Candidatus Omnitrophota bacterium]
MFERFTNRVKKVLDLAKEQAVRLGHSQIQTEHLLLALVREGQGVAAAALEMMGLDLEQIKLEVEKLIRVGAPLLVIGDIALSAQSKKALELAVEEARALGHNYIGTEHLLLGLVRERNGIAAQVLAKLGVSLEKTRKVIMQLLGGEKFPSQMKKGTARRTKTPALDAFGTDLTKLAKEGKLDPVIGREKEIERLTQILCRRKKNNPALLGEAGVGKTAIVEGFAQTIASGKAPEILKDKRVVMLDLTSMVAGTKYRGEFESRIKAVMNEIINFKNIIVFIDELHTLVGAGGAEGAIDASNILKPALSRGEMQCIGATTLNEYRKYIEKDAALERRFQTVIVNPPSVEETIEILKGLRGKYETHHKIKIADSALEAAARLSDRYISGRFLPDKAIDLVDEAASRLRVNLSILPAELKEMKKQVAKVTEEKEEASSRQDFERAAKLRDKERELKKRLQEAKEKWQQTQPKGKNEVSEEEIANIVSNWTGVPVVQLQKEESKRLLEMEKEIHKTVVGQDEAIAAISRAIRRSRAGLKDAKRPIGSFVFLGPTGVGKTLLARALAGFLFGSEDTLVQIDMSEYMEKFAVSRLVGAPPGYVGYEEGGQLTEKIRRKPYSVILLDEIEKAHPDVFNILLQILEDGRLTDSLGRTVDFRNCILIMTSNVGAEILKRQGVLGFAKRDEETGYEAMKNKLLEEAKRIFRPEFLNRLDEMIVFRNLTKEELSKIADLEMAKVKERLAEQEISIELDKKAKDFLIVKGYDEKFGARPLRRVIGRYIEDKLSEEVLKGTYKKGAKIKITADGEKLIFK